MHVASWGVEARPRVVRLRCHFRLRLVVSCSERCWWGQVGLARAPFALPLQRPSLSLNVRHVGGLAQYINHNPPFLYDLSYSIHKATKPKKIPDILAPLLNFISHYGYYQVRSPQLTCICSILTILLPHSGTQPTRFLRPYRVEPPKPPRRETSVSDASILLFTCLFHR